MLVLCALRKAAWPRAARPAIIIAKVWGFGVADVTAPCPASGLTRSLRPGRSAAAGAETLAGGSDRSMRSIRSSVLSTLTLRDARMSTACLQGATEKRESLAKAGAILIIISVAFGRTCQVNHQAGCSEPVDRGAPALPRMAE
jgi:hypothetical protein